MIWAGSRNGNTQNDDFHNQVKCFTFHQNTNSLKFFQLANGMPQFFFFLISYVICVDDDALNILKIFVSMPKLQTVT